MLRPSGAYYSFIILQATNAAPLWGLFSFVFISGNKFLIAEDLYYQHFMALISSC
jgi:hypothetical protein